MLCESSDSRRVWVGSMWRCAVWCVAALALIAASATAQSMSQLNGSVTDPSGAAVPNTKLTLTSPATGVQRTATSNSAGLYQFLDVPPGTYTLEATASGFVSYTATNVTLVVNTPSTVNVHLQLTSVATKVTVEGEGAPLINRTDASLGNTLENTQISQLPIADRNVVQLLSLQPGVAYLGDKVDASENPQAANTDTRSGAVNGVRSDQSNVTLDGIGVNDQNYAYAFKSVLTVPPDSVEEFRVTTADPNADSGYASGAQVALVTKSGTNNFHGSAYEYNRNTIFSANDWFLKQAGSDRPKLLRNVFGGTFGGPIKHNRAFFFTNYEGRRDAQGASELRVVPTSTLVQGDVIYQCQNAAQCPGGTVNGVSGIPAGYYALNPTNIRNMDPLGIGPSAPVQSVLSLYPAGNAAGGDCINTLCNTEGYRFSSKEDASFNTYIARLDLHLTSSGSENLFLRGETENIKQPQAQEFPGQPAASTLLDDSKGLTAGLTSLLSPNLINDFHWGYIKQGGQQAGASFYPGVYLNDVSDLVPFTRSTIYFVPVNQFSDSLNWTKGNHTLQFGTDLFLIRNNHTSYQNSFSDVQVNIVYLNTGGIANTGNPLDPAVNGYPAVSLNFGPNYDSAIGMLMGIFAEGDGIYNYDRQGNPVSQGNAIDRRFAVNDYEYYGQDAWRITPRLTLTYGLRWVLEAPPYETNGLQVAPCVAAAGGGCTNQNVADWFNHSAQLAASGMPATDAGEISFVLGGPVNNGPGLWNWDHKDFSPRVAVAWSPDTGDGLLSKIFGRKDQFSIRGGYSIMYDHFGIPIVNSFDQHGSFGLSTQLGDSAGNVTVANAPRFTCLIPGMGQANDACLPAPCADVTTPGCVFGQPPAGGFPQTPTNGAFAINWGLDQTLKTPYAHMFNLTLSRELNSNSSLQVSYVGSIGRRLPMQVDLAMPTNLTDSGSKMTYFQAATMLSKAAAAGTPVQNVSAIPYFENLFPSWTGVTDNQLANQPDGENLDCANVNGLGALPASPSATQAIYQMWNCFPHNETLTLKYLDLPSNLTDLNVPNSKLGPFAYYHDQFSSLYAWRNIGTSDYNGLQITYNVHWGTNLQGQFNYSFSKSLDEASAAERIGPYEGTGGTGNDLNGGGIVINSWDPLALRGLSDFNAKHQINSNWVYALPFGKGQMFAGNAGSLLNEFIGGWHVSGILRLTSGFPITVDNGFTWATNWNIEGDAMPNGPVPATVNGYVKSLGNPYIFADPTAAQAAFRPEWPGESGVRNTVIGAGLFNIDTGLDKDFAIGERAKAEFSWEMFNATNSVSYNVRAAQPGISEDPSSFGLYTSTLNSPRFMQFALRVSF